MGSGKLQIAGRDQVEHCSRRLRERARTAWCPRSRQTSQHPCRKGRLSAAGGGGDSRDGRRRVQQASLDNSRLRVGNAGHLQIDLGERDAARLDAERHVQDAHHAAHGDQRRW